MEGQHQRELGSKFCVALLLPAFVGVSLYAPAAFAEPVNKTVSAPKTTIARTTQFNSNTLNIETAKRLLGSSRNAADLEYRPPLWDWTNPVTVPRPVAQATPAPTPTGTTTTAQAAPAPDDEGDILDEVSVTATRRPTRGRDTPSVVYSVKKEDFRAQNAQTVTDALQLIPGFYASPSQGGVRNAGGVFLRGFDDQRFQVLKDGLPLQRASNNRSDVSRFQIEDLERIEVVTGGATLRYGSGAVGGVVNLITETPQGPPKVTLQYQTGSYGFSKYVAKYGGGDDTFSYNLVYSGIVAFNNYPYRVEVPREAEFYGPEQKASNPNCVAPVTDDEGMVTNSADVKGFSDTTGCTNGGFPDGTPLYGFLKPETGANTSATGVADSSYAASDTFSGKLTFKPDPNNKITFRATQQNSKNEGNGPGAYYFGACFGGATVTNNGTFNGDRFVPVNTTGQEQGCTNQRYIFNTPSSLLALPYSYNTSFNGTKSFQTGKSYQNNVEPLTGTTDFFQTSNQSQTEVALQHDWNITPTTSLNSYAYFLRFGNTSYVPRQFLANTNYIGTGTGEFGVAPANPAAQPYTQGDKFVLETALNSQISPGQTLSFGVNVQEDRSYQQRQRGRSYFDKSITRSSAFLIDDISFGPELKLNLGVRYTYSTQFGSIGSPGAGIRYTPNSFISVRTNWNYIYNAPSISDLNVAGGPFIANPNLSPESGVAFDAGVDITPTNNTSLRVTYFNIYLDGAIGTFTFTNPNFGVEGDPTSNFALLQQQRNLSSQTSQGYELEGNWQINDQLNLRANWTNVDRRNQGSTDSINSQLFTYQIQAAGVPFNNAGIRLTYANKGFIAALVGRYIDGFVLDYNTKTSPFFTLDFNTEIPLTPFFTLTGSVRNLTDSQYQDPVTVPAVGTTFTVGGRLEIGG